MKRVLITLAVTFAAIFVIGFAVMVTGMYDIDAMKPEGSISSWVMRTTMVHSVRAHAAGIAVPSLDDSLLIKNGADDFREMCVQCHGSPIEARGEVGQGLNPQAPNLAEAASKWTPAELFWITSHGVKMTGMPAFGPTHDEEALWGMVAFIRKLPGMSAEQYRRFQESNEAPEGSAESKESHDEQDHHHH